MLVSKNKIIEFRSSFLIIRFSKYVRDVLSISRNNNVRSFNATRVRNGVQLDISFLFVFTSFVLYGGLKTFYMYTYGKVFNHFLKHRKIKGLLISYMLCCQSTSAPIFNKIGTVV